MSASLIGRLGSSAFRLCTKGPSIMGFEDEVEQSFGRPCRQCDGRFKRTYELTSSIVPRGTSFHRGVELDFLLLHWILHRSQAAAISLVHRNSVPSTHTRCMITANRRASATIAFFIPRCLAILRVQYILYYKYHCIVDGNRSHWHLKKSPAECGAGVGGRGLAYLALFRLIC